MPCAGPNVDKEKVEQAFQEIATLIKDKLTALGKEGHIAKEADEVFEEVMVLLKKKFDILENRYESIMTVHERFIQNNFKEDERAGLEALHKAIYQLFQVDAFATY